MESNFKRNLLIGFNASLVILIVSSVASYVSISNLLKSSGLVNQSNEVIIELNGIRTAVTDAETGQRGYLLTGDKEFLDLYDGGRGKVHAAFARAKTLTIDNPAQQVFFPKLQKLIDERLFYLAQGVNAKTMAAPINFENLRVGRAISEEIRSMIETMQQRERELLNKRTNSLNRFSSVTPQLIIGAAVIALLITISSYLRIRKDLEHRSRLQQDLQRKDEEISNRIRIIRGIADQIAQGSYDVRVDDKQSDALGGVAGSLNRMAESLESSFNSLSEKEWLQTGVAKLNEVMLGEKDVETLCRHVIEFLSLYTQSNVGAIYTIANNELRPIAGYALLVESRSPIRIGDGILGQAVLNRRAIELRDVPPNQVSISFAMGEVKPSHVVAVPVFDGYNGVGAFELASVKTYTRPQIEFMNVCAPGIGIAINIAINRRRLKELLDEMQAQTEELRMQHTEMENLNSELEVHAEKLQASEEELKVQQEELRQTNQALEERSRLLEEKNLIITERNIDIQQQAEQLAQSTKYKSEFLANMSHELRTPLNSILLLSRLMAENQEQNLSKDQIEYARVIQSSGNGLLSLIDEILDLSKIESGKMQLDYQTASIKQILFDMESMFGPMAREKNIELKISIGVDVPESIETDTLRLQQILRNLLSNAIKFTEQGYVQLSVEPDPGTDYISFIVHDTGIGIPLEKQALIFDAFQQADGSTRRKYGGTGLGLSISRELVKLLGGEIQLKSELNEGSEFSITIPPSRKVMQRGTAVSPQPSLRQSVMSTLRTSEIADKYVSSTVPENIPDDRQNTGPFDRTILIIEDDINFAKALLEYTRKSGYKGIVAVRGDEGIELAQQFLPVGIILDIQLPIKSGWDVMRELKNSPATRHIPVHTMSSYELKSESLMHGAVNFINKPVAVEQLQDIFKKIEYVLTHHPKKVLIIDEDPQHAKALAYYLENFDVNIEIVTHVDRAAASFSDGRVDCVILDMGIPDQKSYDTLETVKTIPALENVPIIVFTGKNMPQTEELRIKQYTDSIVVKTANSYKRIFDEVSLFLHLMDKSQSETAKPRFHKLGALDEVLKNKTVLIADDDMRNIFSLTKALEKYNMNVIAAIDGKDALQKLRNSQNVDVVLMDMMMPEMDGYESIRTIRKDPNFKNLPVIAVTAKAMTGDRAKCIEAGASDYITKPVDIDQLFSLLRVWLYEKNGK